MSQLFLSALLATMVATIGACDDSSSSSSSTIKLNEILASSDTDPDWLELYNPSDGEISLAGYELRDNNNFWTFSEGSIGAGEFKQVICDGSGQGGKTSFKLTSKGEQVSIHDAGGALIDRVVFPALSKDTAWGRIPDGDGAWTALATPSPGKPNIEGAPPDGGLSPDSEAPDVGQSDLSTTKPDLGKTVKPDLGTGVKPDLGTGVKPDLGTGGKPDSGMPDSGPVVDALVDAPIAD